MKELTPSQLRQNIYRILDQVVAQGRPISIKRNGVIVQLVPPKLKSRLSLLKKRDIFLEDPEKLVHLNWENQWKPKSF